MDSDIMASMGNVPEYEPNMPDMKENYPQAVSNENMEEKPLSNNAIYPEVFFKLKPHIDMMCDLIDTYGGSMPTQVQLEQLSDGIFDDFCNMYPDMADYMHKDDPAGDPPPFRGGFRGGFRPGFGFGSRRRGIGRDLIDSLLLAGLLSRGFSSF